MHPKDLMGVKLDDRQMAVVMSEEGRCAFPGVANAGGTGIAKAHSADEELVLVKANGNKRFYSWHRSFWRLA